MEQALYKNVAAYKFAPLGELGKRRVKLRQQGRELGLKGTVLLSPEGINLFVSGKAPAVDAFVDDLRKDPELSDLVTKESQSGSHSFNRFLVKLKQEIIAFGVDGVEPGRYTSKRMTPEKLKALLDAGNPIELLDVRNNYEIELGTFSGARAIDLDHFRDFPEAAKNLPQEIKDRPVVTFCTGGIRCEKAAPLLESLGFTDVYQLDGGILRYFEDVGQEHYEGDCFVFDNRVALNANLEPTNHELCFICQHTLGEEDLASPRYIPTKTCPYCYKAPKATEEAMLEERNALVQEQNTPLPGSIPYENHRPIRVSGHNAGLAVLDFLVELTSRTREDWLEVIEKGQLLRREEALSPESIVWGGDRLVHVVPGYVEPTVSIDIKWLYEDEHMFVVHKPAPLPMHPSGRFNKNSLISILAPIYPSERIRSAHRLDAATTGVVVFSRSIRSARPLQEQFERGLAKKTYVARVQGIPAADEFVCEEPISRGAVGGIRVVDPEGISACTKFRVTERFSDGTALLAVTPISGRTNQIRVHLWHLGFPIVGDPIYRADRGVSENAKQTSNETMCLQAQSLEIAHPATGEPMRFSTPSPSWAVS